MGWVDPSRAVARRLAAAGVRVVFAESCTAGLVAATLARVPGISAHLCGSAVTYRDRTKQDWLGLSRSLLADPGAVSERAARQMARGVLVRTAEAQLALSVTGHLGPHAPPELDGVIYVGWARRGGRHGSRRHRLRARGRRARQQEAVRRVLAELLKLLRDP